MWVLVLSLVMSQADSVYASPEVRAIVERAAEVNRQVPAGLDSYRAHVESEAAFVIHTPDGGEQTGQIEQIAQIVEWHRDRSYRQRVVGHRVQAAGPNLSVVTYQRCGWTVPVLYGERLYFDRSVSKPASTRGQSGFETIHPFSDSRERVYRFEGGDTVVVLRTPERTVRIMRIRVTPRDVRQGHRTLAFHGEIDLDSDRHQIVRMRGRLVVLRSTGGGASRLLGIAMQGSAYIDLENAEHGGRYWLPHRQRVEFQASTPLTDSRAVMRIVSRFHDYRLNVQSSPDRSRGSCRLTFASDDTLANRDVWIGELGHATARLHADDFADVAARGRTGPPRFRFGARRLRDVVRYNRVEGFYTGVGAVLALRDAVPGLELRGTGGWAWSEEVFRGAGELLLRRDAWGLAVGAGREITHTNDFTPPLEQGFLSSVALLLGADDDFDYVDRRGITVSVDRRIGRDAGLRLESAWLDDRPEARRLLRGPFGGDTLRLNRPVTAGSYHRHRLALERGRSVNASSLRPGLGASLVLEHAAGTLEWNRIEAGVQGRATRGRFAFAARLDAGVVLGDRPPPQTLYELGTTNGLPGYPYKTFAGDRAVLVRAMTMRDLGALDAPIRVGSVVLPAPSPALGIGWQAGWTAASGEAETVVRSLGSSETGGLRSTLEIRVVVFGGMLGFGIARPLDRDAPWLAIWSVGGIL